MASVEERLAKIEKELAELKTVRMKDTQNTNWVFSNNDRLKGDADLKEIFRFGKELRDNERNEETR